MLLREQALSEIPHERAQRFEQRQDQERSDERVEEKKARAVLDPRDQVGIHAGEREGHRDEHEHAREQRAEIEQPLLRNRLADEEKVSGQQEGCRSRAPPVPSIGTWSIVEKRSAKRAPR